MTRTQKIAEITRLVGVGRWDQLDDQQLEETLNHARVYAAGHKDAAIDDDMIEGAIRMDARDQVSGRVEHDDTIDAWDPTAPSSGVRVDARPYDDGADEKAAAEALRQRSSAEWRGDLDAPREVDPQDVASRMGPDDESKAAREMMRKRGAWASGARPLGRTRDQALAALRREREKPAPGTSSVTGRIDSSRHRDAVEAGGSIYDQVASGSTTQTSAPSVNEAPSLPHDNEEAAAAARMRSAWTAGKK